MGWILAFSKPSRKKTAATTKINGYGWKCKRPKTIRINQPESYGIVERRRNRTNCGYRKSSNKLFLLAISKWNVGDFFSASRPDTIYMWASWMHYIDSMCSIRDTHYVRMYLDARFAISYLLYYSTFASHPHSLYLQFRFSMAFSWCCCCCCCFFVGRSFSHLIFMLEVNIGKKRLENGRPPAIFIQSPTKWMHFGCPTISPSLALSPFSLVRSFDHSFFYIQCFELGFFFA